MNKTKAVKHIGTFVAEHALWDLLKYITLQGWAILLLPIWIAVEHYIKNEPQNVMAVVAGLSVSVLGIIAMRKDGWLDRLVEHRLPIPDIVIEYDFSMTAVDSDKDARGQIDYNRKMSKPLILRNLNDAAAVDVQIETITSLGSVATFDNITSVTKDYPVKVLARVSAELITSQADAPTPSLNCLFCLSYWVRNGFSTMRLTNGLLYLFMLRSGILLKGFNSCV